ncbi:hypothetical protein WG906_09770 [Pedobacter sp. P351]|uniref:hypothetical protein n=1 Tax=Pedobacter superstes TaxID=3133441 RepID=UPI0030A02658
MGVQPDKFRYTLTYKGADHVLKFAPVGWENSTEIKWLRNETYFGLLRSLSVPLQFPPESAELLRMVFYKDSFEAEVNFKIEQLNTFTWNYEVIFVGGLDFSNFIDRDNIVEVNVIDTGLSSKVKAYENIVYEIDIDVPEAIEIELPGIPLQQTFTDIVVPITGGIGFQAYLLGLEIILEDLLTNPVGVQAVEAENFPGEGATPNYSTSDKWFVENTSSEAININYQFELKGAFNRIGLGINIVNNSGVVKSQIIQEFTTVRSQITKQDSFTIVPGEKVFLSVGYVTTSSPGGTSGIFKVDEGLIRCSFGAPAPASKCKALRPKYVFNKLIEKMNGSAIETQSFLLEEWKQLTITSGDAIRQISGAKLKTSFRDFFTAMNSVLNVGFGIENGKPTLESKSYYYKSNLLAANLGSIKDFSLIVANEFVYNSVKIGYQNQNYDELNGRDEFNASQVYSLPVTRIQKELNLVSPYRADCFGIEFTRINLSGKDSTDSNSDNATFFIYLKPGVEAGQTYYHPERSEAYTSVAGVISTTYVFNMKLSPKQCLRRHGDYLHSILDRMDSKQIIFQSADKNVELVTVDLNGIRTGERGDLDVSTLPGKMFLPYIISFTVAYPRNILSLLNKFPTGFVKFTFNGNEFQLFILEASVDVAKNKEQEFRGLLTPNNDLFKLIRKK